MGDDFLYAPHQDYSPVNDDRYWARSKNINVDLLHILESGEMYDCTFRVGSDADTCKLFKCHKVILSAASSVFHTMFFGHFKEAKKDPDDPISLEDTDPEVFYCAMRCIYGNLQTFANIGHGSRVYEFAHKYHFVSLMTAVEGYFKSVLDSTNVLSIYELFYKLTENEAHARSRCYGTLRMNTGEVLASESWLGVSAGILAAILKTDDLNITELDLFRALLRWGEAQLEKNGTDKEDPTLLRAQVAPFLKLIRFESMASMDAAKAFGATKIFSLEEQHSILLTTVLGDLQYLPQEFGVQAKRFARKFSFRPNYYANNKRHVDPRYD